MKIIAILFVVVLFFSNCFNANFVNYMQDIDPEEAPPLSNYLDLTNLTIYATGGSINFYDVQPPVLDQNFDPANYLSVMNVFDANTQEIFWSIQGFPAYVNQTHSYQFQYDISTNDLICYSVANSNYTRSMSSYKSLRRMWSVDNKVLSKNIKLEKQLKKLFANSTNLCDSDVNAHTFDMYVGIYDDPSTPGPISGCQKEYTYAVFWTSRYAQQCYNKTVVVKIMYTQFFPYPYYFNMSPRNVFQSTVTFENFTLPVSRSYRDIINYYCASATDYCTNFLNKACIYPSLPNIPCGTSSETKTTKDKKSAKNKKSAEFAKNNFWKKVLNR